MMRAIQARLRKRAEDEARQAKAAAAMQAGPVTRRQAKVYMQQRRAYPPKASDAAAEAADIKSEQLWLLKYIAGLPRLKKSVPALCSRETGPFPARGVASSRAVGDPLDSLMRLLQRGDMVYPFRFPDPRPVLIRRNAIVLPVLSGGGSDTEPQSEPEPEPEPPKRSQRKRKRKQPKRKCAQPKRKRKLPKRRCTQPI